MLVPNKGGSEDLEDFKPISLVSGLYKILAKVLANILKKVAGKVVSTTQHAIVEDRQILNAILTANEVIDSRLKSFEIRVICNLYIEKVYNHVNQDFFIGSLEKKKEFGFKWIRCIKWCISITQFSILVNKTLSNFLQSTRSLRQTNPLSLYLFIMAMGALPYILSNAKKGDFLVGSSVGGRGDVDVCHLLFPNDMLIPCDANLSV